MTELIDPARLRRYAAIAGQPERWVAVLCWTIDEATRRPIATWALDTRRDSPDLSSTAPGCV